MSLHKICTVCECENGLKHYTVFFCFPQCLPTLLNFYYTLHSGCDSTHLYFTHFTQSVWRNKIHTYIDDDNDEYNFL